jgi:hypothetical protein
MQPSYFKHKFQIAPSSHDTNAAITTQSDAIPKISNGESDCADSFHCV